MAINFGKRTYLQFFAYSIKLNTIFQIKFVSIKESIEKKIKKTKKNHGASCYVLLLPTLYFELFIYLFTHEFCY